ANNVAVATFTDPSGPAPVGNYTSTVNWGDGTASSAGTITLSGTTFTVTASHTYAVPGVFTTTVFVQNINGAAGSGSASATVGSSNERIVGLMFVDILGRPVDSLGLAFWTAQLDQGVPPAGVAFGIT